MAWRYGSIDRFWIVHLQIISAVGLSPMMVMGVITPLKIKDTVAQTLPVFLYCLLNAYLSIKWIGIVG